MPQNVEIKALLDDIKTTEKIAASIADKPMCKLFQEDIFFNCSEGRLKLRKFPEGGSELIAYKRTNKKGSKVSEYSIFRTIETESLERVLLNSLGEKVVVKKERHLYLTGQTRIHIDRVENLGNYIELEVVLKENQSVKEGEIIAEELMKKFQIKKENLISCAYADLLLKGE